MEIKDNVLLRIHLKYPLYIQQETQGWNIAMIVPRQAAINSRDTFLDGIIQEIKTEEQTMFLPAENIVAIQIEELTDYEDEPS